MSLQSVRVHHFAGWYNHSLIAHTDIHSHRAFLWNTHLFLWLSLSTLPSSTLRSLSTLQSSTHGPETGGFVTTVAGHVRMTYLADINTRRALSVAVWMMIACGSAAKVCQVSATRGNRFSRYAMTSDIAAVKDCRPEAGVLAMYPSFFNTLLHVLGT